MLSFLEHIIILIKEKTVQNTRKKTNLSWRPPKDNPIYHHLSTLTDDDTCEQKCKKSKQTKKNLSPLYLYSKITPSTNHLNRNVNSMYLPINQKYCHLHFCSITNTYKNHLLIDLWYLPVERRIQQNQRIHISSRQLLARLLQTPVAKTQGHHVYRWLVSICRAVYTSIQ